MSLQVGDVVTAAEELDALPDGSILLAGGHSWLTISASRHPIRSLTGGTYTHLVDFLRHHPEGANVLYLPGTPPRPERVVKAEALRWVATSLVDWDVIYGFERGSPKDEWSHGAAEWIMRQADEIEATR